MLPAAVPCVNCRLPKQRHHQQQQRSSPSLPSSTASIETEPVAAAISDQHLFEPPTKLAVHDGVAKVEGEALQSTGIRQQLEAAGVAVLEDQRIILVGISRRRNALSSGAL